MGYFNAKLVTIGGGYYSPFKRRMPQPIRTRSLDPLRVPRRCPKSRSRGQNHTFLNESINRQQTNQQANTWISLFLSESIHKRARKLKQPTSRLYVYSHRHLYPLPAPMTQPELRKTKAQTRTEAQLYKQVHISHTRGLA